MDADARRILLAHDWLTGMRGGEKCLEPLARRWSNARLYTLLHRRGSVSAAIERLDVRTSWLQHVPASHRLYRYFLPLMPASSDIETFPGLLMLRTEGRVHFANAHRIGDRMWAPPDVRRRSACCRSAQGLRARDQGQVGEGLGKVPHEPLGRRIVLLREQPHVVLQRQQAAEQGLCLSPGVRSGPAR